MQQRSEEWYAARCGKATASRMADLTARTQKGWGASRANYAAELVVERLTGRCSEGYCNPAMQHGLDTEPEARESYCFRLDVDVEECGFIDHPSIAMSGASPDGLIGDNGLLEIKCPQTAAHIAALLDGEIPDKYVKQMQWQMACTGRQWCDFASYDPRLPESMRLFVKRVHRDDQAIALLEGHVVDFLNEVDLTVAQLRARYERELEAA